MPLPKKIPRGGKSRSLDADRVFANRYCVEKKLGSGSFGTVYLVQDMRDKYQWKVLKEIFVGELAPDETVDAMREAKLLSTLHHVHIVKFHDSFLDRESFCIITEYCEGGDLDDKIKAWKNAGKTFDESLILTWFIQMTLAVKFMHEKKILHRDLKTRNIFLKRNVIKLGDLGISRILMGTSDMATTFTGTPYYMSPEVLKHEGYKYKSDIWSMGVVLYELCNLQHAFQGESLMGVMYKIVERNPPKLSERYSKELQSLYERMLDKNPTNRPSATEILKNEYIAKHSAKLKDQMSGKCGSYLESSEAETRTKQQVKPEERRLYQEPRERPLTPMDKMKMRKQQKADEEAERIRKYTASQVAENQAKYSTHKKKQSQVSLPWVEENPDVFNDVAFSVTTTDSIDFSLPLSPLSVVPSASKLNTDEDQCLAAEASLNSSEVSEIPDEAELAETFYSQFEDEFENDDSEDNSKDDDDLSALMGQMQVALEQTESDDEILAEDQQLTDTWRRNRIQALRTECERLFGAKVFQQVYSYLESVRFGEKISSEDSVLEGLSKIVNKPGDCFLVDQLLFLEKQAEISAMT
ncbi:serine/threonine-protein kinase Nek11-like [Acropora muricata]|uniref:serine/threonine-protein kinase Nek11-like n=1 Tax=Acropora muricata TaxID=159855 RepID=UPI0034E52FC2